MIKTFTLRTYFISFTVLSVLTIFLKQNPIQKDIVNLSPNNKVTSRRLSAETQFLFGKKNKDEPEKKKYFKYQELVFTTIDVKPVEGNSKKVHFSGATKADLNDQTAVFLKNIVEIDEKEDGRPVLEADLVSIDEVKNKIQGKHVLLCIHGYWDEPISVLTEFKKSKWEFANYHPIPVLWPTYDIPAGNFNLQVKKSYNHDKDVSKSVGKTLGIAMENLIASGYTPSSPISIVSHSMGNRVLRYFASELQERQIEFKVENIFMVAADVNEDIFEHEDGVNIVKMLMDGGKVYVVHRKDDDRLQLSARYLNGSLRNPKHRLGQFGADLSKLHSNTEGKIKNINVLGFPAVKGDEGVHHNYHLANYMIWLYESESS